MLGGLKIANIYHMMAFFLCALNQLIPFVCATTVCDRHYYYFYFVGEKNKACRSLVPLPSLHSQ